MDNNKVGVGDTSDNYEKTIEMEQSVMHISFYCQQDKT